MTSASHTGTAVEGFGNNLTGIGIGASLGGAVANAPSKVLALAQTCHVARSATKVRGLVFHVGDTLLLS